MSNSNDDFDLDEFDIEDTNQAIDEMSNDDSKVDEANDALDDVLKNTDEKPKGFLTSTAGKAVAAFGVVAVLGTGFLAFKLTQPEPRSTPVRQTTNQAQMPARPTPTNSTPAVKPKAIKQHVTPKAVVSQSSESTDNPAKPAEIDERAVSEAINFNPQENSKANVQKRQMQVTQQSATDTKTKKLEAINKTLSKQLESARRQEQLLKERLEELEAHNQTIQRKAITAKRTRIPSMQIIDFHSKMGIALVKTNNQRNPIIALSHNEPLRIGGSSVPVNKIDLENQLVLIGDKYFIDSTWEAPKPRPKKSPKKQRQEVAKKDTSKQLKSSTLNNRLTGKRQRITDYEIAMLSSDKKWAVVVNATGITKRLSVGKTLDKYGRLNNILSDGTLVFNNHVLHKL